MWALETRGRKNGRGRAARALRPPARVTAVTRSSPAAPQLCVKVVQAKALEPVYVRERPAASQMPSLSAFVAVHHGSQSKMTHVANDVVNPRWNSIVELWDCEMCETIEFIVVIRAGGALWKHSMVTMNMEQFRAQPEYRFEQWWALGSVSKLEGGGAAPRVPSESASNASAGDAIAPTPEQFGELLLVATYTEDCYQPSLLQSLFCNVMYCPMPGAASGPRRLPRAVPRNPPKAFPRRSSSSKAMLTEPLAGSAPEASTVTQI